jgi:hypothetical protein
VSVGLGSRRISLGAVIATCLAVALSEPDAAKARSPVCPPERATVLAAGRLAVAYASRDDVHACYRPTGARYFLGYRDVPEPNAENVDLVRVNGFYVVWGASDQRFGYFNSRVFRLNLRTGRIRGQTTGTDHQCPGGGFCGFGNGPTRQLVLNGRGSFAWISGGGESAEVWRSDGRGRKRLARGSDVDATFLRRRGRTVEWREAGTVRRASLRP